MTTPTLREAAQQALEALAPLANATTPAEREALTDADAQAADAASCDLRAALAEQAAEEVRPDIIERLTYHALERDDLTLDDCLAYLAEGWKRVRGRTERQMVLQLTALLAGAPAAEQAEPQWQLERMRHIANEWADMATNGLQWLRNIKEGISNVDDALANMARCYEHCRRVNDAQGLYGEAAPPTPARQEPPADWSVFNTGAEVAGGLTYAEALEYLTPPRLERGWSAVCVVNKDNITAAPAEGGAA